MELEFDKEMLDEFVSEAREHLETIEEDFLNLEKQKDDPDPELVNKVFRAIHTIKGCAGFLGMTNINGLAHVMETLLSMVRNNEIKPELKFVDPLLKGVDTLNAMLDNVETSNDMNITEIHSKLSSLLSMDSPAHVQKELDTNQPLSDLKGDDIGFDITEFTLKNIPDDELLYILKYDLTELMQAGGRSPVALIKNLLSIGDIIDAKLETSSDDLYVGLPVGPLLYELLFATKINPDDIAKAVELEKDCITQVNREILKKNTEVKEEITAPVEVAVPVKPAPVEVVKPVEVAVPVKAGPEKVPVKEIVGKPDNNVSESAASAPAPAAGGERSSSTIRINVDILEQLMMLAGELVLVRNQQLINVDKSDPVARTIVQRLDIVTSELQESIMRTRMQPIGNVLSKFTRIVRDLGNMLGKKIDITIIGAEVELDKTILESLADPLTHLVRNCCDHGVELPADRKANGKSEIGHIELSAYHEGGQINIEINDDGKGINVAAITRKVKEKQLKSEAELAAMSEKELMALILLPGFSTAETVSDISGRGVGMDVVKSNIEKLGGTIDIESAEGKGTKMHLRLPLTLAIIPCLIVMVGDHRYAIPQVNLVELMCLYDDEIRTRIECAGNNEVYRLRNILLPMVRLSEVLSRPKPFTEKERAKITEKYHTQQAATLNLQPATGDGDGESGTVNTQQSRSLNFTVLKIGNRRFGLIVDKVLGTEEIVVKPMHPALKSLSCYSGATVMGDGKVALILDVDGISRHAGAELNENVKGSMPGVETTEEKETHAVLLFKNGEKEQFAVPLPLIRRIECIDVANIERVGNKKFITVDGVSTLVLQLEYLLEVSPGVEKKEMFLLLPKHTSKPFGILISNIVDIAQTPMQLNEEIYMETGLMGSLIVNDHLTLFIDIYGLIEKAEPSWFKERTIHNDNAVQTKKRILLLEDTPFFRQLIKGYLVTEGYDVVTAENGKEGLSIFNEAEFDLIVSDIEMPVMDGITFLRNVRNGTRHNNIPAIAVTALDSVRDKESANECGFNLYETKFNKESFLSSLKTIFN